MFWTADLRGKGPLSRLWQACHQPKKIPKKAIEDFSYKEGYDAIMDPSDDRMWALRLNGQLLLGFVRIHSLKVQTFQDSLKTLHERLTIKFTATAAIDLDISKSRWSKPEARRNEDLQLSITDMDLVLDLPDEIPSWLQSEEWQMSQTQSDGFGLSAPSPAVSAISSRRSALINLPNNRPSSASGFGGTNDDDLMYSDILEVPGGEMPPELEMNIEDIMGSSIKGSSIKGGESSTGAGGMDAFDVEYNAPEGQEYEDAPNVRAQKDTPAKQRKRTRKSAKLDACTQISKDECRMWVSDVEWVKNHLCKPRRILGQAQPVSIRERVCMPLSGGFGKTLTSLFEKLALPPRSTPKKARKSMQADEGTESAKKLEPKGMEYGAADIGDFGDYGMPDVDYGGFSESGMPSGSVGGEDPEKMRAGSEERRVSKESQGLNKGRRSESSDGLSLPSFDLDSHGSPRPSSLVSDKSRLASIGEIYDPLSLADDLDDTPFKDASLKEEPESYQTNSQLPISQRLSEYSVLVAKQIAIKLPKEDSELSLMSLVRNLNSRNAARCFYSVLVLVNENIVQMEQDVAYGDIIVRPTENTAMYAA